jgi:Ferredoxin subunits of nitrite reductase and ring-hydroxylating dioxygenases
MASRVETRDLLANEIAEGGCAVGSINGKQVAIFRIDSKFYATQAECTHRGGPLCEGAIWAGIVTCPWHGSEFNIQTGAVGTGPAEDPLQTYNVTVVDGKLIIEVKGE